MTHLVQGFDIPRHRLEVEELVASTSCRSGAGGAPLACTYTSLEALA